MRKNLKKLVRWGLASGGFTADFNPNKYRMHIDPGQQSWSKFEKYVDKKEKTVLFNRLFRPAFKAAYQAELDSYRTSGMPMNRRLKKEIAYNVKLNITQAIKAQIAAKAPAQQSYKEQENILPEG